MQSTKQKGLSAEIVARALAQSDWSPTRAARLLGVTRNTVNYWIDRGNLERKTFYVPKDAA